MKCRISRSLLNRLAEEARAAAPEEACGLLLGEALRIEDAVQVPNAAPDPHRAFLLEPGAHLGVSRGARERGLKIMGHYHSHPSGIAAPSACDAAAAQEQGLLWLILAGEGATLWLSQRGGALLGAFEAVELEDG